MSERDPVVLAQGPEGMEDYYLLNTSFQEKMY